MSAWCYVSVGIYVPGTHAHRCPWDVSAGQVNLCVSTSVCTSVCIYPERLRSVTMNICHWHLSVLLGVCLCVSGSLCLLLSLGSCAFVRICVSVSTNTLIGDSVNYVHCVSAPVFQCAYVSMLTKVVLYVCICVCVFPASILYVSMCVREGMSVCLCVTVSACHCGGRLGCRQEADQHQGLINRGL